jgi:hypothetical protein
MGRVAPLRRDPGASFHTAFLRHRIGRSFREWLAGFLIAFGVWDIFCYVFLKLLISGPASLWTWDILFLLPNPLRPVATTSGGRSPLPTTTVPLFPPTALGARQVWERPDISRGRNHSPLSQVAKCPMKTWHTDPLAGSID